MFYNSVMTAVMRSKMQAKCSNVFPSVDYNIAFPDMNPSDKVLQEKFERDGMFPLKKVTK